MVGWYYRVWVDCIKKASLNPNYKQNWKSRSMVLMTMAMSSNFILLMTILELNVFKNYFYKIDFSLLPNRLNNVLVYFFLFILPCGIVNYLLIIRKDRYKKLVEIYPSYSGKLAALYIVISIMLPVVLLWIDILSGKISVLQ